MSQQQTQVTTGVMAEFSRFCTVGATAYVIDVAMFNLCIHGGIGPLSSKTIAVVMATTWAYFGNRRWAFSHRGSRRDAIGAPGEYALFFAVNGVGLLIALACLGVSYYLIGLTSPLAQNVAANGVGFVLGTLFRFWAYRTVVFPAPPDDDQPDHRREEKSRVNEPAV